VRDTLSLLDQLIAGSEGDAIEYERAVALLGYTHSALLDEVVDAIGERDAPAAFSAVDRVIQTGQDPRRFVEDLLERLRDLVVIGAFKDGAAGGAAAVLRGIPQDELDRMTVQAARFGEAELSRAADVVGAALTEMTGATSPRLHLELMIARVLVPASDSSERGTLARVERLERRVGVEQSPLPEGSRSDGVPLPEEIAEGDRLEGGNPKTPTAPVTFAQLGDAWPEILEVVGGRSRNAWAIAMTARPMGLKDDVLALAFPSQNDVDGFKKPQAGKQGVSELLRQAIIDVLGIRVKFIAKADAAAAKAPSAAERDAPHAEPDPDSPTEVEPEPRPAVDAEGWAVAPIPTEEPAPSPSSPVEPAETPAPSPVEPAETPAPTKKSAPPEGKQRYGEAVVREILGANFLEEQPIAPRVTPTAEA
jgi:DNA polymerase-3 subunit gamma/tau